MGVAVGITQSKKSSNASGGALRPSEVAPSTSAANTGGIATPTAPPAASTSAATDGRGGNIPQILPTALPDASTSAATDGGNISTGLQILPTAPPAPLA